jgi:hypothetical protein
MAHFFRLTPVFAGSLVVSGCITAATTITDTHKLVSAEPIQTVFIEPIRDPNTNIITQATLTPSTASPGYEKEYLGFVLIDSGQKCQAFTDRLSTAQRGVDTGFDILSGILSGLATAFTPLSTVHALTAAATISTGTKSAIAADVYAKATASLILQQINSTYYTDIGSYRESLIKRDGRSIVPALEISHIQAIHQECSLDAAIASLSRNGTASVAQLGAISGALAGANAAPANPTAGAVAGAAAGAAAAVAGSTATAPEAAAKQGAEAAAAVVPVGPAANLPGGGLSSSQIQGPSSAPVPIGPPVSHPKEQPCAPLPKMTACPPLAPEFRARRKTAVDELQRITDVAKLRAIAQAAGVTTPVASKRCIQRDLSFQIANVCTDDQLQGIEQAIAGSNTKK